MYRVARDLKIACSLVEEKGGIVLGGDSSVLSLSDENLSHLAAHTEVNLGSIIVGLPFRRSNSTTSSTGKNRFVRKIVSFHIKKSFHVTPLPSKLTIPVACIIIAYLTVQLHYTSHTNIIRQ